MLTRIRPRLADEDGITLVELLVVMVLMTLIGGAVLSSLVSGMKATASTQTRYDALADLQKSVGRMTRELRAADPLILTANPAVLHPSTPERAVVEIYRDATFSAKLRYTYTYCPPAGSTPGRIHVRQESLPAGAPQATNCAAAPGSATHPGAVLIDRLANGVPATPGYAPVFRYLRPDGTATTEARQAFQLAVTVRRSVANQVQPITVDTRVRIRNAR